MSVQHVRLAGTRSVLVELEDLDSVLALNAALEASPLPGQLDVLTAASTVLIKTDSHCAAKHAAALVPSLDLGVAGTQAGKLITVEVTYNGADLAAVAELTGQSVEAVIAAHTSQTWTAAFGGFAPGFAYLLGENSVLDVPRRSSPRTAVPSGSVALAGGYSAVYPRQSPGGWQLLGHTETPMWDPGREHPALIRPQDRVQFVPVTERTSIRTDAPSTVGTSSTRTGARLQVLDPGLQSLFQDLGRPGQGNLGVTVSGAADTASSRQANRLVGNRSQAVVIENLTGSMQLRALRDVVLAVTGAEAGIRITPAENDEIRSERSPAMNTPFALLPGETLALTPTGRGLRSYLAVRGGFSVEEMLDSASSDTLSGLGPQPLAAGQQLAVGPDRNLPAVGFPEPSTLPHTDDAGDYLLRVVPGPRDDWFGSPGLQQLVSQRWGISAESNRVGVRLLADAGGPLTRIRSGELASEGVVPGALQVPPSGLPVLFLTDHPVTGGYPVIATVVAEDLSAAAQLPPGATIRFALVDTPPSETEDDPA